MWGICTCFYILRKFQENIHATATILLLFILCFSILLKKVVVAAGFFFSPWAHINFIKGRKERREGSREEGRKEKEGEELGEREGGERKKQMQKKKRRKEKTQPTTNQPTEVSWQLGFSRHRKWFSWKNYRNLHHRRKLTMCEGKSLPMITKRSFSGEH